MKKYITIISVCILFLMSNKNHAQQLPIYSQYMFNDYLINSAYAGTYDFTPVILNHRNQWIGFGESAPQTSSISMHKSMGENSALGSSMIYDKTHPISTTQMELSYAYHAILNGRSKIGLSMALGGTFTIEESATLASFIAKVPDFDQLSERDQQTYVDAYHQSRANALAQQSSGRGDSFLNMGDSSSVSRQLLGYGTSEVDYRELLDPNAATNTGFNIENIIKNTLGEGISINDFSQANELNDFTEAFEVDPNIGKEDYSDPTIDIGDE